MTLSTRLRNVDLTLECKRCGHLTVKNGSWFMTISTFKCKVCKSERRLTYSDKVALFAKHAHLALDGTAAPDYAREGDGRATIGNRDKARGRLRPPLSGRRGFEG